LLIHLLYARASIVYNRFSMGTQNLSINTNTHRAAFTTFAIFLCGGLVILTYVWFISTGLWTTWPATTTYYDQLATSFHEGHLYLDIQPDQALLQLSDPYEPDARNTMQGSDIEKLDAIWDMSLYGGKIYLYWGPVPALILAAIKLVSNRQFGDQQLTFIFISGLFLFQTMLLLRVWRRFLPALPIWAVLSAIILVGFINPIPWILNTPRIYEAAIAADQFFLIGGLYFIFSGLDRQTISIRRLVLAATLWVFAVGSRATMAIPVSFLLLIVILKLINRGKKEGAITSLRNQLAGFCIPLLSGAILLGWYNQARFGSFFEFGFRYAITMFNQNKFSGVLFSPIYIIPNSFLYFFNPPVFNYLFPFIRPAWNGDLITNFNNHYSTIYNAERIVGLIYVFPFFLFSLIPIVNIIRHSIKQHNRIQSLQEKDSGENNNDFFRWILMGLIGATVLELLTVLILFYGTMRYFMDVIPTLSLLSIFGFWQGYLTIIKTPIWGKVYPAIGLLLIISSIIISILLGYSSDVTRIKTNNLALITQLRLFFIHLINYSGR